VLICPSANVSEPTSPASAETSGAENEPMPHSAPVFRAHRDDHAKAVRKPVCNAQFPFFLNLI
jgi:hypothetical protein